MFVLTSFYPLSFLVILLLLIHESLCAEEQHCVLLWKKVFCVNKSQATLLLFVVIVAKSIPSVQLMLLDSSEK